MSRLSRAAVAFASVTVSLGTLVACGAAPSDVFKTDGGAPTFDVDGATPPPVFGDGGLDGSGEYSKCATATARPDHLPIKLVIQFDKSASMLLFGKWDAAKNGFNAFFADPASKSISASLSFFPQGSQCGVSAYATPTVPLTALPDKTTFSAALGAQFPSGDTPTLPAIQGAIQYAQSLGSATKVAIILVSDGDPNVCSSTVQAVSSAVAAVASSIPTYVVGIGNVSALNAIAQAGGTKQATIVSTNSPQQTAADLQKALDTIREEIASCEYVIPPPPQGKTFDPGKVNVVFTPTNGPPQTLSYDPNCTGGVGWRYDDPKNPKTILLCSATCDARKKDPKAPLDVVLGCKTMGAPVN